MAGVHLELINGRRVRDTNGKVVGRIGEIVARLHGHDYLIEEYHLGPAAWLEHLGISSARIIGWHHGGEPLKVPWQQLDLSDPQNLRLRCTLDELKKMQ
ncbi:MAG TPA: hypothetical protein VJ853_06935 [Thermoanaerobaculia bacterium]|nr:hypothetical protein [Thermoanaerobaculia bacterium]